MTNSPFFQGKGLALFYVLLYVVTEFKVNQILYFRGRVYRVD